MFTEGSRIFLHFPNENSTSKTLNPGLITEDQGGGYMAVMDDSNLRATAGSEAFVYFEQKREFMQQPIRIDAVLTQSDFDVPIGGCCEDAAQHDGDSDSSLQLDASVETVDDTEPRILIGFQTTGEPVSAESRQCYRTLTSISSNVNAMIDSKIKCPVLDVSATGFSILSENKLREGQVVRVSIQHDRNDYDGSAVVQSTKQLDDGRFRYGLYCAGDEKTNGSLFKGLREVGTTIQREQIRRMKGA